MQINRLFEIVYILLDKKIITAKQLSQHFEVSVRTIYRDIDVLSGAGIPIFTNKGKGGGISLLPEFVLNKSVISELEQNEILLSLQSLKAVRFPNIEPVLQKLSIMFSKQSTNFIEIDFSYWGSSLSEIDKFNILKDGIISSQTVEFDYFSSYGEKTYRIIEPLKLIFKSRGWYCYGFCRSKNDFRLFRISRIKNIKIGDDNFSREIPEKVFNEPETNYIEEMTKVRLIIDQKLAHRVYDEYDEENIEQDENGNFIVTFFIPEDAWIYGYILSFGDQAEVLEPDFLREDIMGILSSTLKKYYTN